MNNAILDSTMQTCLALKADITGKQVFLQERLKANRKVLKEIRKMLDRMDYITGQLAMMKAAGTEPNDTTLKLLTETNNFFIDAVKQIREAGR